MLLTWLDTGCQPQKWKKLLLLIPALQNVLLGIHDDLKGQVPLALVVLN
jgi:hypothetical protein